MKATFKYVNRLDKVVEFILEPWAEEYQLLPQQELVLVGRFEDENAFCQVDDRDDCVIFFAWEHSLVEVYIDGEDKTLTSNSVMF